MKLRIRGNAIRLRLTQSEVRRVGEGELVQEAIEFAQGAKLYYVLEPSREVLAIEARFIDHRVSVLVPMNAAKSWATSNDVSLTCDQALGDGRQLFVLIEKDFACLKPRTHEVEDESDMFVNPNEAHGNCGGTHV